MVLKDWKRRGEYWYLNKKLQQSVVIYQAHSNLDYLKLVWKVQIGGAVSIKDYIRKEFKTESSALAFAKKYMRSH